MNLKLTIGTILDSRFPRIWMERELRFRPNHFEPEFHLVPLFCNPQSTAIDIGANAGSYSYFMAKYAGQVIAFEPNLDLWARLRTLLGRNVRLESAALSATSGQATFRVDHTNTGVATIEDKNDLSCVADKSIVETRTIETRTLDSFQLSSISLIKIDTEGHEESVIEGAQQTLTRNRPVLIIESEDRHNPGAPRRLAARLDGLGYACFYLRGRQLQPFSTIREDDLNPANPSAYINNFLFIPSEQTQLVERVQAHLAASQS